MSPKWSAQRIMQMQDQAEKQTSLKSQFYFNDQKVTMMLIHQSDKETLCDALG